jgi:hypothetical protein
MQNTKQETLKTEGENRAETGQDRSNETDNRTGNIRNRGREQKQATKAGQDKRQRNRQKI